MTTTSELEATGRIEVQDRAPRIVFWVLVAAAFPIILRIGAYPRFLRDEWSFLSGRSTRRSALELHPRKGTTHALTTPLRIQTIDDADRPTSKPLTFRPVDGNELTIELPNLSIRVDAPRGQPGFALCEGRP